MSQGVDTRLCLPKTAWPPTFKTTISEVGANSKAEMGKVMAAIMPKVKGKADGSLVNKLVQQHLS